MKLKFFFFDQAIIGDDIGQDLLPRWIERKHFEIIKDCLSAINKDINDLEEHYKLNINYLSNRYELSSNLAGLFFIQL